MKDRERLLCLLNECKLDSLEAILSCYFDLYEDKFSAIRMYGLVRALNNRLEYKIRKLDEARFVANERAGYLKRYLDGTMWKDEELAKRYLQPQIENAQAIIDACKQEADYYD